MNVGEGRWPPNERELPEPPELSHLKPPLLRPKLRSGARSPRTSGAPATIHALLSRLVCFNLRGNASTIHEQDGDILYQMKLALHSFLLVL